MNDFNGCYHPTIHGQLNYSRDVAVGHGNHYTAIHPYFCKASFLNPCTHHYLKKILTEENFNQVRLIISSAMYHHCETLVCIISPRLFSSYIQLKIQILSEAIISIDPSACDSTNPSANEASSDNNLTLTNTNDIMLNDLLKSISDDTADDTNDDHDHYQEGDTARVNVRINCINCSLERTSR